MSTDRECRTSASVGPRKRDLSSYLQSCCRETTRPSRERGVDRDEMYARFYDRAVVLPPFAGYGHRVEPATLPRIVPDAKREEYVATLGIPELSCFFDDFDPVNEPERHPTLPLDRRDRTVGQAAFEHLASYLLASEFGERLLRDRANDATVHAIVSFALTWNLESLERFEASHPSCRRFARALHQETYRENGAYVYRHRTCSVPFVRTAFKIVRNALALDDAESSSAAALVAPEPFVLINRLPIAFVEYLQAVYRALRTERFEYEQMRRLLEQSNDIPYDVREEVGDYRELKARAQLKFITGQACCGKTTLLNVMRQRGWRVVSRGSVGSFAGKSSSPVAVACLHASIDWALRHDDVLGDRGHIDNPLWVGIMQFCDPRHRETLVTDLLTFVSENFNAATLGFFIAQRGAVFVDPYPSKCSARMLRRGTGGDPFRGRIATYAIVQTMAYLTVAKLFDWRLYCVPYDRDGNFEPRGYSRIAAELHDYFGEPGDAYGLPRERYGKPTGARQLADLEYSKSVGIFK